MCRYVLGMFILIVLVGCDTGTRSSIKEFSYDGSRWHSIERTAHRGAIAYRASEVPLHYYLAKHLGMHRPEEIDSLYQDFSGERVIVMEFEEETGKDLLLSDFTGRDYDASVRYMAFDIQEDFYVETTRGDSIPCRGVLFERNFKVAPFKRLLLHFGDINPDDKITLVYKDQLFGKGTLHFDFDDNPIEL